MVAQSNVKKIISDIGKKYNLSFEESQLHYDIYIKEYILKSLYEADFDILRIDGLGTITPSLIRSKKYQYTLANNPLPNLDIKEKVQRHIDYLDELNMTLKKKKLHR